MGKKIFISDFGVILAIGVALWLIFGIMTSVMFVAIYCGYMWLNLTITTVANALNGQQTDKSATVLRWLYILLSSECLAVFFTM